MARVTTCLTTRLPQMYETNHTVNGRSYTVNLCASPVVGDDGCVSHVLIVMRDATHLRQLERQLEQTHKLEALGRLAGGIAHDFNNLLACIQGNLDLALAGRLAEAAARQGLQDARAASHRASELVHQILLFARQAADNPRSVDLNAMAREMLGVLRGSLPPGIGVILDAQDGLWPVRIDPAQPHRC